MSKYLDEAQAAADGFEIVHQPEASRFAILRDGAKVGEAHYSLRGEASDGGTINFDHTFVAPAFRGTGLSDLLAHRAVTDDIVRGRSVKASCWFIREYLAARPGLLAAEGDAPEQ